MVNEKSAKYNDILNLDSVMCDSDHILPIFFKTFYPKAIEFYDESEREQYEYIQGLKYIQNEKFVTDKEMNEKRKGYFEENKNKYINEIEGLVKNKDNRPIVLCSIPSSKVGKDNIVSLLVKHLADTKPIKFKDGRNLMKRVADKETMHESNSKRTFEKAEYGLSCGYKEDFNQNYILVIDDVTTSGASFNAAYDFLVNKNGISPNKLLFFAFGKTMPNVLVKRKSKQYSNFIFDLGNTIYQEPTDIDFIKICEIGDWRGCAKYIQETIQNNNCLFKGISKLFSNLRGAKARIYFVAKNKFIATIFLENYINELFGTQLDECVDNKLYTNGHCSEQQIATLKTNGKFIDEFTCVYSAPRVSFNSLKRGKEDQYMEVPSPAIVQKIISEENLNVNCTIGVGNSIDDMIAFKTAGIDAALAQWGNRGVSTKIMKESADLILNEPQDLNTHIYNYN